VVVVLYSLKMIPVEYKHVIFSDGLYCTVLALLLVFFVTIECFVDFLFTLNS